MSVKIGTFRNDDRVNWGTGKVLFILSYPGR